MRLRKYPLMNAAEAVTSTAAPAAPDAAAAPAAAPAAPAEESLLPPIAAPAGTPEPAADPAAPVTDHGWLPEKFRVNGADGKLDLAASSQKLSDSYRNLERTRGSTAPASPEDYKFTPPEDLKDLSFDEAVSKGFRERAHKAGLSAEQYQWIMGEYVDLVPQMLDGAAQASAAEARAELSKVWQSPTVFEAQINNAARAVSLAPESIRADLHARFGRDPAFLQFAAHMGAQMREDRGPQNADGGTPTPETLQQLMQHPAYRDSKHPEHAAVSARAQAAAKRMSGG